MEPRPVAGPYRGERMLGIGSTGTVWRARGPRGVVALKVARGGPEVLAAEAQVLRTASHPHLVRFVQSGPGWLVTELVDGTAAHRWAVGRDTDAILDLAIEVVGALRHLHDRGLVHGDLKPAHVLVDAWDHAKLVDPMGRPVAGRATPGFAAPEVVSGALPTSASDAWSLGALLAALLTGQPPYPDHDPVAALHAARTRPPLPPSAWRADVPAAVDALVLGLLRPEPARRPTLADAERVLVESAVAPPTRPLVGMFRARRTLLDALARAAGGEPVIVILHGPQGSGRRSLISETLKRAAGKGLPTFSRLDPEAFVGALTADRRPVAGARTASAEAVDVARRLRESGRGGLLMLHGPAPHPSLSELGAIHVAPDTLTRADALQLGRWLGVDDDDVITRAWERAEGLPRALWLALGPMATRRTEDRSPFSLPVSAMSVGEALGAHGGVLPMDRLAEAVGVTLHEVGDLIALLLAAGLVQVDPDGWRVRTPPDDTRPGGTSAAQG